MNTYITTKEAAALLNCSTRTLERYRQHHQGPRFHKYGRCVRYRRDDLDRFVQEHRRLD